jgi:hypothetical protein
MLVRSCVALVTLTLGFSVASGASALEMANGLSTNGLSTNGLSTNGLSTNGLSTNGLSTNGLSTNGLSTNGLSTNGLDRNGSSATADEQLKAIILQDGSLVVAK